MGKEALNKQIPKQNLHGLLKNANPEDKQTVKEVLKK